MFSNVNAYRVKSFWAVFVLALAMGAAPPERSMEIDFIDVDGGAATLVVGPEGESVLIDTGWRGFDDRDAKRIEHVVREVAKLDHLDHLVITHWHSDHFGGVEGIAKRLRIDHFWDRGLPDPSVSDNDAKAFPDGPKPGDPLGIAYLSASHGKRKALKPGDSLALRGSLKTTVLASGGQVIDVTKRYPERRRDAIANPKCDDAVPDHPIDGSDNARSLAILFELGRFGFLDCGDLTWNVEKKLVCPFDLIGQVDLYQVTHHGLDSSNHPTLLATIEPTVAIMNNGPHKGGSAATVRLLRSTASIKAAYQLHKNAATTDSENTERELIANADPTGGKFIRVVIDGDGERYHVEVGGRGDGRTFETK